MQPMKTLSLQSKVSSSSRFLLLALLLSAPLAACGSPPHLDDDEGGPQPSRSSDDHLSVPYATGTKVRIALHSGTAEPTVSWRLVSDQPAVLAITGHTTTSDRTGAADVSALSPGQVMLRLLDGEGKERHSALVTVATPDRVRVLAHGLLRTQEDVSRRMVTEDVAAVATVQEARVLSGATGVFGVAYFAGSQRVYGRGLIQFDPIAQVQIENRTTTGSPLTEWLFVKPLAAGSYTLNWRQKSGPFPTLPIVGVAESELASVSLVPETVVEPKKDHSIWVYSRARDVSQRDVFGVYTSFSLDGVPQQSSSSSTETTGDLYRYSYDAAQSRQLLATRGSLRATLSIPASKGSIYNTTYLGCSQAGLATRSAAPQGGSLALGLLLCGWLVRRATRRRVVQVG